MKKLATIFGRYAGLVWSLLLIWCACFFSWVFQDLSQITTEVNIALATVVSFLVVVVRLSKE
jgi:hypothetical protein